MIADFQQGRRELHGFTLMEILFGVLAFALVMGVLHTMFFSALRLRENAEDRLNDRVPTEHAIAVMERDLRGLIVSGNTLAPSLSGISEGTDDYHSDQLEFYTTSGSVHELAPWPEIQKVQYYLGQSQNFMTSDPYRTGQDLIRSVTRNLLASVQELPETQRLLSNVESMEIDYFDGEQWLMSWDSRTETTNMPSAIRIHIRQTSLERTNPLGSEPLVRPLELVVPIITKQPPSAEGQDQESDDDEDSDGSAGPDNQGPGGQGSGNPGPGGQNNSGGGRGRQ